MSDLLTQLEELAARPVLHRVWLHDDRQWQAVKALTVPRTDPRDVTTITGAEVLVDAEENPWPDRVILDYRSRGAHAADRKAGRRAWEVIAENVVRVVGLRATVESWLPTTRSPSKT